ncbi:MAG: PepSY domain-containing protein [Candidatus Diapherotrites archaeon]|nr:PepSY domain-containing protein [Candidatus Diapherotrites archaeon]
MKSKTLFKIATFAIIVIILTIGCVQSKSISKEDAIKIAESHGIGLADGRIVTNAKMEYNTTYNKSTWLTTKTFSWNRIGNFGEEYIIDAENGNILKAYRFDSLNDFNKTIQEFDPNTKPGDFGIVQNP